MTFVPENLNVLNYPIETELQEKFWGSRHKCNKAKSIIAFSLDLNNANDNMRRYGYTRAWRQKAIEAFGQYVNTPSMIDIPFSSMSDLWWDCMPYVDKNPFWYPSFSNQKNQWIVSTESYDLKPHCFVQFDTVFPSDHKAGTHNYFSTDSTSFAYANGKVDTVDYEVYINGEVYMDGASIDPHHLDKLVTVKLVPYSTETSKFYFGADSMGINHGPMAGIPITNIYYTCSVDVQHSRHWPYVSQTEYPNDPTITDYPEANKDVSRKISFHNMGNWELYSH